MHVMEIYYDHIDWGQFPFGLTDFANDISLKADKNRTPEQREQFKQEVTHALESDRLMMAQQVEVCIVGVAAHFFTPWGDRPVTGQAFEEDAIDALLATGDGDPFVVHALAYETSQRAIRQALQNPKALRPLAPVSDRDASPVLKSRRLWQARRPWFKRRRVHMPNALGFPGNLDHHTKTSAV